jgi:hypothetical protein
MFMKHLLTTIAALMLLAITAHAQTNRFAATIVSVKTNDQSVTNTTNFVDIDGMSFVTQPNAKYDVTFYCIVTNAPSTGVSTAVIGVASNATIYGTWNGASSAFGSLIAITSATNINASQDRGLMQRFMVFSGTNSGTIKFQFSQATTNTNPNTIRTGTFLRADRMPQ